MTSYETERALVHFAEQIIKTFGKEIGIQDLIQGQKEQGMKYRGLFTFDEDNHKYVPVALADGIIDLLDTTDYVPTEPLIKDAKIRKAVRAWAEANDIDEIVCYAVENGFEFAGNATRLDIRFNQTLEIDTTRGYTIAELCGERKE